MLNSLQLADDRVKDNLRPQVVCFFCVWYFFSYYYFTDCEDMWKSQSFFEGNTFRVNCVVGRDIFFPLVLFIILKFFSLCFLFFHKVLAVRPFSHFFFLYRRWRVLTRKFEGVSGVNRLATKQGRKILLTTDKTGKNYRLPTGKTTDMNRHYQYLYL